MHVAMEAMDKKQLVGGIFCDLQKAFDSVNHEILMKKIQLYGIRGKMGKLLQSYITDRYQKVYATTISLHGKKFKLVFLRAQCWDHCFFLYI